MAQYVVTSPDGQKYRITAPDNAAQADVMAYAQKQFSQSQSTPAQPSAQASANVQTPAPQASPSPLTMPGRALLGALETGAHLVTGTAGQIAGGVAGLGSALGGTVSNLVNGQSLPQATSHAFADAGNTVNDVESALTYEPRTVAGQLGTKIVQYPFQKLGEGADYVGEKVTDLTGSPTLGAATDTAINAVPMLAGAKGDFTAPVARPVVPDVVANARGLGFKLTPTQAQTGILGRVAESLSSHAKLERNLSRQNARAVDAAAGQDIGVNGPITTESLTAAKAPHNAVYDEVGKLGSIATDDAYRQALGGVQSPGAGSFPLATSPAIDQLRAAYDVPAFDAADAVAKTRQLRADAGKNIKAPNAPEQNALGYAQKNISDALEAQIERHLQNAASVPGSTIDPTLISRFQGARQSLARIHSVEDALKAGKGQAVSASNLGKQLQRGVPLSGNLRTIAESAQNFPRAFQDLDKIRNSGPLSMLPTYGSGIATALHPAAWPALAGAVLGPPALRAALTSDLYQRAASAPRVPLTATRPGLLGLGGLSALAGQGSLQPFQQAVVQ